MKLYFNPKSRAVIAKWMLDECGAKYELVPIDFEKKENKTPEFLAINPAGKLPALVDGGTKIFEGAAIGLYLGDKFPEARLAPPVSSADRGRYLSLMVYSTSQLEPAMGDVMLKQATPPSRGWRAAVLPSAVRHEARSHARPAQAPRQLRPFPPPQARPAAAPGRP